MTHYTQFSFIEIPELKNTKNLSEDQQKQKEEELIMQEIAPNDELILLDEHGAEFTSVGFSEYLQKKMNAVEGSFKILNVLISSTLAL
mgnify:CR=1 FL=1